MKGKKVYNIVLSHSDLACVVEALSEVKNPRASALLGKVAEYIDALDDNKPYIWEVEE